MIFLKRDYLSRIAFPLNNHVAYKLSLKLVKKIKLGALTGSIRSFVSSPYKQGFASLPKSFPYSKINAIKIGSTIQCKLQILYVMSREVLSSAGVKSTLFLRPMKLYQFTAAKNLSRCLSITLIKPWSQF